MAHNSDKVFIKNTHILLVDHDKEVLASTARVLGNFQYKVTTAESGSEAMYLIFHGKETFDLVLMDAYLPDFGGFNLLHETIGKGIPTILASNDHGNVEFAKLALQYGATLFLEKPITIEVLKTLWQHVVKDKIMKARTAHGKQKITAFDGATVGAVSEDIAYYEYNRLEINQKTEVKEEVNGAASESRNKRRSYTRWTEERHRKFVTAMFQLGDDYCYPKDILELMNEPNLTRLQVASHLQKCRLGKWRGPKTDKNLIPIRPNNNAGVRKYGKMPNLEMLKISQAPRKQEYQEARDTYELPFMGNSFGDYPSEKFSPNFGGDFDKKFLDEAPNNYQLPGMDDSLKPFNNSGSVQENFHLGSNLDFS